MAESCLTILESLGIEKLSWKALLHMVFQMRACKGLAAAMQERLSPRLQAVLQAASNSCDFEPEHCKTKNDLTVVPIRAYQDTEEPASCVLHPHLEVLAPDLGDALHLSNALQLHPSLACWRRALEPCRRYELVRVANLVGARKRVERSCGTLAVSPKANGVTRSQLLMDSVLKMKKEG